MERPQFVNECIYHIYNRGVEKRDIFLKDKDYLRFIVGLHEFNDRNPAFNLYRARNLFEVGLRTRLKPQEPPVSIFAFCLMPNHYHLMLQQKMDNGITEFMRKLGTGYTNYFNLKYNRVGPLFQGKFKAVLLEKEAHFLHLPHYIHLNPLDLKMPEWRNRKIKDIRKAIDFLERYRWSSLPDYLGMKNFASVIEKGFLTECIGTPKDFRSGMKEWITDLDFSTIQKIAIEEL